MTRGVSKSGSPTPRLMTSSIVAAMSKNRRMPDGGTTRTRSARTRSASGARDRVGRHRPTAYGIDPRASWCSGPRRGASVRPAGRRSRPSASARAWQPPFGAGRDRCQDRRDPDPSICRIMTNTPKPMTGPMTAEPDAWFPEPDPEALDEPRATALERLEHERPAGGEVLRPIARRKACRPAMPGRTGVGLRSRRRQPGPEERRVESTGREPSRAPEREPRTRRPVCRHDVADGHDCHSGRGLGTAAALMSSWS